MSVHYGTVQYEEQNGCEIQYCKSREEQKRQDRYSTVQYCSILYMRFDIDMMEVVAKRREEREEKRRESYTRQSGYLTSCLTRSMSISISISISLSRSRFEAALESS